jgi:hypothetical protein
VSKAADPDPRRSAFFFVGGEPDPYPHSESWIQIRNTFDAKDPDVDPH